MLNEGSYGHKFYHKTKHVFPIFALLLYFFNNLLFRARIDLISAPVFQGIKSNVRTSSGMFVSPTERKYPMIQVSFQVTSFQHKCLYHQSISIWANLGSIENDFNSQPWCFRFHWCMMHPLIAKEKNQKHQSKLACEWRDQIYDSWLDGNVNGKCC